MNGVGYGAGQDRERKKITSTRTTRYVAFLSVVLALALTAALAACGSAETDREALVALYNVTNGENWNESNNWLSDAPLGEWEGVTTDSDGRVTAEPSSGTG